MYKNLRQPIYIQAAVAAAMLFFGVTVPSNILTSGILVVFAGFLLKDAYEMVGSEYVITEESLQLQVHGKVKWEIKWRELDMVTRTKKNPRWVVVSDGKEFPYAEAFYGRILKCWSRKLSDTDLLTRI